MAAPVLLRVLDAPSRWPMLDPLAARIKSGVDRVLPAGLWADLLHGKAIGHPAHPPLAQLALGGWSGAGLLGAVQLAQGGGRDEGNNRDLLAAVGLAAALPAVAAGLADWSQLHEDQQRTGMVHAAVMAAAASVSLAARVSRRPRRSAALDLAATLVATAGAALGGHLAYRWSAGPNHAEAFPHLAREGWIRVCRSDGLADDELRAAVVGDEPIVVGRAGSKVFALADRCSHLGGPLHEGAIHRVEGRTCLVCPWHGSAFDIQDGDVVVGPALAPQPVLEVRSAYGWIDVRTVLLPRVHGR